MPLTSFLPLMALAAACGGTPDPTKSGTASGTAADGGATALFDLGPVDRISSDNYADLAPSADGGVLVGSFRARKGNGGDVPLLTAFDASGDTLWSADFAPDVSGRIMALAADPAGGFWAAVVHEGAFAYGEHRLPPRPGIRTALMHWTPEGRCDGLWPFRGQVLVTQLAADAQGRVYAAGNWTDSIGLGAEAWKPEAGSASAFVLCRGSEGVAWWKTTSLEARRLVVGRSGGPGIGDGTGEGRLIVAGSFREALRVDGRSWPEKASGGQEGVVLVLDADGAVLQSARFGSSTQPGYGYRSREAVADIALRGDSLYVAWLAERSGARAKPVLDLRISAMAFSSGTEAEANRSFTAAEDVGTTAVMACSPEGDLLLAVNVPEEHQVGGPPPDLQETYQRVPALMRFRPGGQAIARQRFRNTGADPFAQFRRGYLQNGTWWLSGHARGALSGLGQASMDDGRHHLLLLRADWREALASGR